MDFILAGRLRRGIVAVADAPLRTSVRAYTKDPHPGPDRFSTAKSRPNASASNPAGIRSRRAESSSSSNRSSPTPPLSSTIGSSASASPTLRLCLCADPAPLRTSRSPLSFVDHHGSVLALTPVSAANSFDVFSPRRHCVTRHDPDSISASCTAPLPCAISQLRSITSARGSPSSPNGYVEQSYNGLRGFNGLRSITAPPEIRLIRSIRSKSPLRPAGGVGSTVPAM